MPLRKLIQSDLPLALFWGIPMGYFFWILLRFAVDAPYYDDYLAILGSLLQIANKQTIFEVFQPLFAQHNEHRLVLLRLIALMDWGLNGTVNFRHLIVVGNLFLVGICVLMVRSGNAAFPRLGYAPLALLLFQLRFYDSSLWTTAALSHYPVILLALASLMMVVSPSRNHFSLACLLASIACYSQGNGQLIFIAGFAGLILLKRYRRALIWMGLYGLLAALFFNAYIHPTNHPSLTMVLEYPWSAFEFLFLLLGAVAIPGESAAPTGLSLPVFSLASGILLAAAIVYLIYRRAYQMNLRLCLMVVFLLASAVSVVITRIGFGTEYALSSRYAVYSAVLIAILYLLLLEVSSCRRPWIVGGGIALATVAWLANCYTYLPMVEARQAQLQQSTRFGKGCYEHLVYPTDSAAQILSASEEQHLYFLRDSPAADSVLCRPVIFYEVTPDRYPPQIMHTGGSVDTVSLDGDVVVVNGWANLKRAEKGQFLHLALSKAPAWHSVELIERPDVVQKLGNPAYLKSGFSIRLHFLTIDEARQAAGNICVAASSSSTSVTLLNSENANCRRLLALQKTAQPF